MADDTSKAVSFTTAAGTKVTGSQELADRLGQKPAAKKATTAKKAAASSDDNG